MLKSQTLRVLVSFIAITTLPACCASSLPPVSSKSSSPVPSIILNAQKEASSFQKKAQTITAEFKPAAVFDHYSAHPPQVQYYGGVKSTQSPRLAQAAQQTLKDTPIAKTVLKSALVHPHYEIADKDDTDALVHTFLNTYSDCHAKQLCHTSYKKASCLQSPLGDTPHCRKTLVVSLVHADNAEQSVTVDVSALPHHSWQSTVSFTVNLSTGQVFSKDGVVKANVTPLVKMVPCDSVEVTRLVLPPRIGEAEIKVIDAPACSTGFRLQGSISASGRSKAP